VTYVSKVKDEIIKTTKQSAQVLIDEAKSQNNEILSQVDLSLNKKKDSIERDIANYSQDKNQLLEAETQSYKKSKKLMIENNLIEIVFEKAISKLGNLSDTKRKKHIDSILTKTNEFPIIFCSKKDSKLVKKAKIINIIGGLILENKTGDQRVDFSYESMVDLIKKKELDTIYGVLFENDS